jgi:hypothetical protein
MQTGTITILHLAMQLVFFCGGWILVNSELYCFFVEKVYRINPPENYINKINILNIGREIAI